MISFAEKVYGAVRKIPQGKVLSYKEVAHLAGFPKAYRAVGRILNKNRDPKVPCHRVIRSDGKIGGYAWGEKKKRELLKKEGAVLGDINEKRSHVRDSSAPARLCFARRSGRVASE